MNRRMQKKNLGNNLRKTKKALRSRSVGTCDFQQTENLISQAGQKLGVLTDKHKQQHTYTNEQRAGDPRGSFCSAGNNVMTLDKDITAESPIENVFKPRTSVCRTPPGMSMSGMEDRNQRSQKRQRSESSPVLETASKKHNNELGENIHQSENDQADLHFQPTNSSLGGSTESMLNEILQALDLIQENAQLSRLAPESTSLRENANRTYAAMFTVYNQVTRLTYKIEEVEKENLRLQNILSQKLLCDKVNHSIGSDIEVGRQPQVKDFADSHISNREIINPVSDIKETYAEISQKKITENDDTKGAEWTTPKIIRKLETVVNIDNITDPKETLKQIKQGFSTKETDGGLKNIRSLKSGGLILESHTEVQQKKLRRYQ